MFYEKVNKYCEMNGISIHEFEQRCGLGNGTVGGWKNKGSIPKIGTLKAIAEATSIPIEKWVKESE